MTLPKIAGASSVANDDISEEEWTKQLNEREARRKEERDYKAKLIALKNAQKKANIPSNNNNIESSYNSRNTGPAEEENKRLAANEARKAMSL